MFKLTPIAEAIFEGFLQRIVAIKKEPLPLEPLKDFGIPNYGFMLFDYNWRNYRNDTAIGNMLHMVSYLSGWVGNNDKTVHVGASDYRDLEFDLNTSVTYISLQSYIDDMSTGGRSNRSPKFLITYHITYDLAADQTPRRLYFVRFFADSGVYLLVKNKVTSSILPDDHKVDAPAKVHVRITKVTYVTSHYDTEWREQTLTIAGQNPFTLTADQMFHPTPMTFLTYDKYIRKLDKPLKPQIAAEFEVYKTKRPFIYMEFMNTMRLKNGAVGDHRLNGYDVLTLSVQPPRYPSSTEYYIRAGAPYTISNSSVYKEDRLVGSWYPNSGSNVNKPQITDPIAGIIPEQINVTGRGQYFDDRDPEYVTRMITYQHPAVKNAQHDIFNSYLVPGYVLTIDRSLLEYDESRPPFFDISKEGFLDIKIEDENGLEITLLTIKWKVPESTSDYIEAQTVIRTTVNGKPDWSGGKINYTATVNVKLIDTYSDNNDGTDPTKPLKPISALFYCEYVDPPIASDVIP